MNLGHIIMLESIATPGTKRLRANDPDSFQGRALRDARRLRGLTQNALADLIGVSQSCVSKWEGGFDPPSFRVRKRLIDVFLNRAGTLNPLIDNMIKYDPSISVYDFKGNKIYISPLMNRTCEIGSRDLIFHEYQNNLVGGWRLDLCRNQDGSERLLVETEFEFTGDGKKFVDKTWRVHSELFFLQMEPRRPLYLSKLQFLPVSGEESKVIKSLTLENMV